MANGFGKKDLSIILLAIALAAVLVAQWLASRQPVAALVPPKSASTSAPVNTKALEEALQKVAAETLAAPSLSNEQIAVKAAPGTPAERQGKIVALAEKLGGSALKSTDEGQLKVIARLPAAQASAFREQLGASPGKAATEDQWFEVIIQP